MPQCCNSNLVLLRPTPRRAYTLIELLVVIGIISILLGLGLAGVQKARASAARIECANHLRQMGLAFHQFHDNQYRLPAGCSNQEDSQQTPYITWMTRLLPYLEQDALWQNALDAFRQDLWFESPPHHPILGHVVTIFTCPADSRTLQAAKSGSFTVALTAYQGVEGTNLHTRDGILYLNSKTRFADIRDGLSNTLMVGERPPSADRQFGWWYAGWGQAQDGSVDSVLGVREIIVRTPWSTLNGCSFDGPYEFGDGHIGNQCDALHFWSLHPGGANFLFADGSVHFLPYSAKGILPALATRAGGEIVELP